MYILARMKHSNGNYTPDQTARCCQLGGDFASSLDGVFSTNVASSHEDFSSKQQDCVDDVRAMVEDHVHEALFDVLPGRSHRGFDRIRHGWSLQKPKDVCERIEKHINGLHVWKVFNN